MRARDAVGKYRQKVACVHGQNRTVPAAAGHRGHGSAMDNIAIDSDVVAGMVHDVGLPLAGHRVAVV